MTLDLKLNKSEIELYNNMAVMGEVVTPCKSKINTRIQKKDDIYVDFIIPYKDSMLQEMVKLAYTYFFLS